VTVTTLRGMTWDHPRGTGPVRAATARWVQSHPEVDVSWDARPLRAFEDQPIAELAAEYDLLMIDHPHVGLAVGEHALLALDERFEDDFLREQEDHAIGSSFESYTYAGRQWALAVDAAAQVGSYRAELLAHLGAELPRTWDDVAALARDSAGADARLLLPLNPTHAWCTVLSLAQSGRGGELHTVEQWTEAFGEALEVLVALIPDLDHRSERLDPIAAGQLATTTDQVLGIPLAFGYVTFARTGMDSHRRLTHVDAPRGAAGLGSVLGGVGIALSARSSRPDLAADLARLVASPEFQRGQVVEAGGQPGHRSAWVDPQLDEVVNQFFSATINSLDTAFVRPRDAGAGELQRRCGDIVHERIWRGSTATATCARQLGRLMAETNQNQERA